MPRYKLTIEYDGTPYFGWQLQGVGHTVQAAMEAAIFRFSGEQVRVNCCGRTDTGVHALGQIAHVDLSKDWPADKVRDAMNAYLKLNNEAAFVLAVHKVDSCFDARFSAQRRYYLYRILDRRPPAPLRSQRVWHVPRPLDVEAMNAAAKLLVGPHDFTTFRATACQARSPEKTLEGLDVRRVGDEVEVHTHARSFLHNQVRSMVGSLVEVGAGRWTADDLEGALKARDRKRCGPVAPPFGLYFVKVDY